MGGKSIMVGVPYGTRARLITLYLQSEALRTQSRDVELGNSIEEGDGRVFWSIRTQMSSAATRNPASLSTLGQPEHKSISRTRRTP